MEIIYREIDAGIEERIISQYGSWIRDYGCLKQGEGCYRIAALCGGTVAGFAALYPARWIPPLHQYQDAFIDVIEVDEPFRRQGIGSRLAAMMEAFAKAHGYRQIRAWSSDDKAEALHMWYKLGYCMCPAAMLGKSVKPGYENQQIVGYYYAKMLNFPG